MPEGRIAATLDAIPSLKRAIALDPQFALAYASAGIRIYRVNLPEAP